MPARVGNAALPWLQQNASGGSSADGGSEISLKAFDDMLELYGGVLTICLNSEVEPPDCSCPRALQTKVGRSLCGIDPLSNAQLDARKVARRK